MEIRITLRTTSDEVASNPQKWVPQYLDDVVAPEIRRSWANGGSFHDSAMDIHWEIEEDEPDIHSEIQQRMSRE